MAPRFRAWVVALLVVVTGCATTGEQPTDAPAPPPAGAVLPDPLGVPLQSTPPPLAAYPTLPGGRRTVFGDRSFLVAYYGTAATGALGVLGETSPDRANARLVRAGRPFLRPGERLQPVYELIVTVADGRPGRDGDYSHDLARSLVRAYLRAAHRHGALVVLDLQPGRSHFPTVARRWAWALRDPLVGLALDPEWRMGPRQVPARVIGSVSADEVNRTSAWLAAMVRRRHLPQKLFVVHQFRSAMIRDLETVRPRAGLAMVQHVDGFGTPRQKLATYHAVVRPHRLTLGFKLFYDEDRRLMSPDRVRAIRPRVRFVSYQ